MYLVFGVSEKITEKEIDSLLEVSAPSDSKTHQHLCYACVKEQILCMLQ
jgi:hypothetical protein